MKKKFLFPCCSLYSGTGIAHHAGRYGKAGGFVPEIVEIASYFKTFTVVAPVFNVKSLKGMDIFPEHIRVYPLISSRNYIHHWVTLPINAIKIFHTLRCDEAIMCYVPNIVPLGTIAAILAKLKGCNPLLCIRGSLIRTLRENRNLSVFKRIILLGEHLPITKLLFLLYRNDRTFVTGYKDAHHAQFQGLHKADGFHPILTPLPEPSFHKRKHGHLLFVGRIEHAKGIQELVTATRKLVENNYRIRLHLAGRECDGGFARKELIRLADEYPHFSYAFLSTLPYGKRLFNEYAKADILVLPSYSEAFGKVLVEGLCSGTAIVASDVGGIPEIIHHEINGLLVKPKDADDLFKALKRLLDHPDLKEKIRTTGIKTSERYRKSKPFETIALEAAQRVWPDKIRKEV